MLGAVLFPWSLESSAPGAGFALRAGRGACTERLTGRAWGTSAVTGSVGPQPPLLSGCLVSRQAPEEGHVRGVWMKALLGAQSCAQGHPVRVVLGFEPAEPVVRPMCTP